MQIAISDWENDVVYFASLYHLYFCLVCCRFLCKTRATNFLLTSQISTQTLVSFGVFHN